MEVHMQGEKGVAQGPISLLYTSLRF